MALEVIEHSADSDYPSRTARWTDGYAVATPAHGPMRAMHWARQAVTAAGVRSEATSSDAFATWTAAVEAVWWVAALDDLLDKVVGKKEYRPARAADDCGQVVLGLRWLRHLHIHEIAVTGTGGPKKPFFPPPRASYVVYISPSNRWLPSAELKPRESDPNLSLRDSYDAVVAGLPLSMATDRAVVWHDRVVSACGFPPYLEPEDPTVL
jgi:hypothetical protein